jgi:membrane associated rhomboid family serine protease
MASPPNSSSQEYGQPQDQPQQPPEAPVPTCFRHPGRQTYVSCVRCGRPACPDCLRPAAVGHQCVECIKAGNQGARRAVGMFGGSPSRGARVTYTIMAINVVLYVVLLARPNLANDWAMLGGARDPSNGQLVGVAFGQWYRVLTSAFLPPTGGLGLLDIAFNLWALWIVGPAVERVLGPVRFLGVYLASAVGGALSFYLLVPPYQGALGASGAIFGLFGAWFVLAKRMGVDWRPVVTLIVLNLVIGFVGASYIAWQDHIGGLVTGIVITAAYAYAPRKNRAVIQGAATVVVFALLILGFALRDYNLVHQVIL